MTRRICEREGCHMTLSKSNPGPFCWAHTPDLANAPYRPVRYREVDGATFLANLPGVYDLTDADRKGLPKGP